jgi:hypothetical protein
MGAAAGGGAVSHRPYGTVGFQGSMTQGFVRRGDFTLGYFHALREARAVRQTCF